VQYHFNGNPKKEIGFLRLNIIMIHNKFFDYSLLEFIFYILWSRFGENLLVHFVYKLTPYTVVAKHNFFFNHVGMWYQIFFKCPFSCISADNKIFFILKIITSRSFFFEEASVNSYNTWIIFPQYLYSVLLNNSIIYSESCYKKTGYNDM
jgi:hypothetical protein